MSKPNIETVRELMKYADWKYAYAEDVERTKHYNSPRAGTRVVKIPTALEDVEER